MKDLDFDELDKAVNTLMGSVPAQADNAAPTTSAAPASTSPVIIPSQPVVTSSSAPEAPAAKPTAAPSTGVAPPAQRRGGQFMDMIHGSSNMKPRPVSAPSRQGITVEPRSEPTDTIVSKPAETAVVSQAVPPPSPVVVSANDASSPGQSMTTEQAPVPEPPLESPFLSDAKVEKRPLNPGRSATASPVDMQALEAELKDESVTEPLSSDDHESPRPYVPIELDSDLVAIEASDIAPDDVKKTDEPSVAAKAAPVATGPTSIAQQYREETSSGDQSHAAIYDTSQFPTPLTHPAKKKSGWLWVVWVVLLLCVGAGGAIALYLAGII